MIVNCNLFSMEPTTAALKLVWRCHQLLSGLLAKGHLLRVSYQSPLLATDEGDIELILWAVHRSPGIYLVTEENLGNLSYETV